MQRPSRAEIERVLANAVDRALTIQGPVVRAHIEKIEKADQSRPAEEIISRIERQYLATVTTMGGAAGATAAAPAVGAAVALPINLLEVGTFLEATALFVLAVAEVHQIEITDLERRRTLLLAVLIGNGGTEIVQKIAGRTGPHWARQLVKTIPMTQIHAINKLLGKNFVTKYGTKQGILVLGRELPLGIGAVIGATGNAGLGYLSIRAARNAFGPPPPRTQDARAGTRPS